MSDRFEESDGGLVRHRRRLESLGRFMCDIDKPRPWEGHESCDTIQDAPNLDRGIKASLNFQIHAGCCVKLTSSGTRRTGTPRGLPGPGRLD